MGMEQTGYYLNTNEEFVIENYNNVKPFSSFLPAIAGLYGKPMWAYYVNRGQCIATFGIDNKDYSIMEFHPANKAYRRTSTEGFRTFLKIRDTETGAIRCYEPFKYCHEQNRNINQNMYITSHDLKIEDVNRDMGIKTEVTYCTLPGEFISGLVRTVNITNISDKNLEIEMVDGMPLIIPYNFPYINTKVYSNVSAAWMTVENFNSIPFYKTSSVPSDSTEVTTAESGYFYMNFSFKKDNSLDLSKVIVESALVFGTATELLYPEKFFDESFSFPEKQVNAGVVPCGFGYRKFALLNGESELIYTLAGSAEKYKKLESFAYERLSKEYLEGKINENKELIEKLKSPAFTLSSSKEFDLYCRQSFLDNFLRGGYPIQVGNKKHPFYVYSRKHGDLEREYNFFQVDATYYSQGNANFRDVNQNRRNDVYFFPFIEDDNIKTFFNLIQLDGYNPLLIKGSKFKIDDMDEAEALVKKYIDEKSCKRILDYLQSLYAPGELLGLLETLEIDLNDCSRQELLEALITISQKQDQAEFGEGYWVDHWIYNIDLLDEYLSIYPDRIIDLLFHRREFTYFESGEVVLPRDRRYVLTPNGVRQYEALAGNKEKEKERIIKGRKQDVNKVRDGFGHGNIYKDILMSKILCLLLNKVASLDSEGIGVEMEANKPGWCDALNGLPGVLGSSLNESVEIKRLADMLLNILEKYDLGEIKGMKISREVYTFFSEMFGILQQEISDYEYWNLSEGAKEKFREATLLGLSGDEDELSIEDLTGLLKAVSSKIDRGLKKACEPTDDMYPTYFINEVTEYEVILDEKGIEKTDAMGRPFVKALSFKQRPIPYFLEGPVHVMRVLNNSQKASELHKAVKKTGLYDEKLEMFKVCDNVMNETKEIGRQNAFPRGWLENEAIFLHMEYKYILELLKCGLYEEYFYYFRKALIPFLDPSVYGRSILENSSFIASSVNLDEKIHGTGFVSRLTGASSEVLSMLYYMTTGSKPFCLNKDNKLCFELKPILPGWMFTDKDMEIEVYQENKLVKLFLPANVFVFNFLGKIPVVYHNESRRDTFGENAPKITKIVLEKDGNETTFGMSEIPSPYSQEIRDGLVNRIDMYFE